MSEEITPSRREFQQLLNDRSPEEVREDVMAYLKVRFPETVQAQVISTTGVSEVERHPTLNSAVIDVFGEPSKHLASDLAREALDQIANQYVPTSTERLSPTFGNARAVRKMDKYLKSKNLTVTTFAIKVGVDERTIRNFRDKKVAAAFTIKCIADTMGMSVEEFLS